MTVARSLFTLAPGRVCPQPSRAPRSWAFVLSRAVNMRTAKDWQIAAAILTPYLVFAAVIGVLVLLG